MPFRERFPITCRHILLILSDTPPRPPPSPARRNFAHGLLSGIGHPVLGFDHLFFVLVAGVLSAASGHPTRGVLAYIGAMLVGCIVVSFGTIIPLAEALIAVSLLVAGGWLAAGHRLSFSGAVALLAGFGLFHGAAFGTAITGQEGGAAPLVLIGYLIGLGFTQFLVARSAGLLSQRISTLQARLGGAMASGVGLFLCLEMIEGALLG